MTSDQKKHDDPLFRSIVGHLARPVCAFSDTQPHDNAPPRMDRDGAMCVFNKTASIEYAGRRRLFQAD
ncbi:MAG: hypothetical protein D8M59_04185 [Planctomycetes bacterium]|nr:hypothetical protein [Planctomycetota bacterium]